MTSRMPESVRGRAAAAATAGVLVLATSGASVATLCDLNHVVTGTLSYAAPSWFGQPWWSWPAFFVTFVAMGLVYHAAASRLPRRLVRRSSAPGTTGAFAVALAAFAAAYLASGVGNHQPALLVALLYGTFALRLARTYERPFVLGLAVFLAVAGMAGEGTMSAAGLVAYRDPDVAGVPLWLGAVYAHGALCLREGMRAFPYRMAGVRSEPAAP